MRTSILLVAACYSLLCFAQEANPLVVAICGKSETELRALVDAAGQRGKPIEVPADADKDALAAAIYNSAKAERPDSVPDWPGCAGVPAATKAAESATKQPAEAWAQMVDMLFKTQDKDKDGKLTREELQKMIDATNAQAKSKGVSASDVDFFTAVDTNADGFAERAELEEYFKKQMTSGVYTKPAAGAGAAPKKAAKAAGGAGGSPVAADMHKLMFDKLDANRDGSLSMEEMKSIIEATNKNAANQASGETGEDFFKTLDRNGDGSIDPEEAKAFFDAASGMLGGNAPKDEV